MNTLFTPRKIRNLEIKNRIILPPMVCFGFSDKNGFVSKKNIYHYERIAKSGTGMIIVEAAAVSESGRIFPDQLGIWCDDYIEGLDKIAHICHTYNAKVILQLHHAGLKASKLVNKDTITSSDYIHRNISARAMTKHELHLIQQDFISAALRAQKAGFDGVEFHGAHSYLMTQFFSTKINKRVDEYGGSLDNRLRFTMEILQGVKQKVDASFVVGIRMGCNESDLETSINMAKKFQASGMDYIHVSTGYDNTPIKEEVPKDFPCNWIVYGAAKIKEQVNIPVIAVNSIKTKEQANYLIDNNLVDFVAIGRAQLADHDFTSHIREGKSIIKCLGCKPCRWFTNGDNCPRKF
ncbi:NADH:flavin oxidoreductase [Clostridium kluyveri]|uniref:NADH oxidase n=1 Tax=Clostridium kluyveri TaxID=1534 RepID=A0A1L5F9T2_CLOKL|nr:NADH:flavin oxidoreductase [Clostridium kluyveri]APM39727.1 NADH oxidase [Clostridium kluyveri]UZQ50111.1 NADH:flavin oxidoreductase [Clostridium kluyveri]